MLTPNILVTLPSTLPPGQVVIIEGIVYGSGAAISKSTLLREDSLIANKIGILGCLHKVKE